MFAYKIIKKNADHVRLQSKCRLNRGGDLFLFDYFSCSFNIIQTCSSGTSKYKNWNQEETKNMMKLVDVNKTKAKQLFFSFSIPSPAPNGWWKMFNMTLHTATKRTNQSMNCTRNTRKSRAKIWRSMKTEGKKALRLLRYHSVVELFYCVIQCDRYS